MWNGKRRRSVARSGFTLVELLVVITIIGILMAMVLSAIFATVAPTKEAAVFAEVSKMDQAMAICQTVFTQFPPDGSMQSDMDGFTKSAFPDRSDNVNASPPPADINPARALVFWLSRINTDVTDPYRPPQEHTSCSGARIAHDFFSFAPGRVNNGMYYPQNADPKSDPPYVYFCSRTYREASYQFGGQSLRPYHFGPSDATAQSPGLRFAAPGKFQIVAAGRNKEFGRGGRLLTENSSGDGFIAAADEDNIVNFDTRLVGDIRK